MAAGSVVVVDTGVVASSTGAAGRLFVVLRAGLDTTRATFGLAAITETPDNAPVLKGLASTANSFATWLVTELTSQTTATISTSASGLQRMPASTAEDTETKAPGTTKTLPLAHTT